MPRSQTLSADVSVFGGELEKKKLPQLDDDGLSRLLEVARRGAAAEEMCAANPKLLKDENIQHIIQAGKEASNVVSLSNLGLVGFVISKHFSQYSAVAHDEMISNGFLGLMHSVWKFMPRMGHAFSTYSTYWIRQHIKTEIDKLLRRGPLVHGQEPTDLENGKSRTEDGDSLSPLDRMPAAQSLDRTEEYVDVSCDIDTMLAYLTPNEMQVMQQYMIPNEDGYPRNFSEIGEACGFSSETTRKLFHSAVARLKTTFQLSGSIISFLEDNSDYEPDVEPESEPDMAETETYSQPARATGYRLRS